MFGVGIQTLRLKLFGNLNGWQVLKVHHRHLCKRIVIRFSYRNNSIHGCGMDTEHLHVDFTEGSGKSRHI